MFNINSYVVYKRDVCKIVDKKERKNIDYYILKPVNDDSLKIEVPVENKLGYLRNIIKETEARELINLMPDVELINIENKKQEYIYKQLMNSGDLIDLVKIIKTAFTNIERQTKLGKRPHEEDERYFNNAEKHLFNELSLSLNMSFDETKKICCQNIY